MNNRVLILYHKNCSDGIVSAGLLARALKDRYNLKSEVFKFIPVQYGETLLEAIFECVDSVFMVDFTYFPLLEDYEKYPNIEKIYIIDHHKTAYDKLIKYFPELDEGKQTIKSVNKGKFRVYFSDKYSGAGIIAKTFINELIAFYNKQELEALYMLGLDISDRDTWQFKRDNSKVIHEAIMFKYFSYEDNETFLKEFLNCKPYDFYMNLITIGETLLKQKEIQVRNLTEKDRILHIRLPNGELEFAVNSNIHQSEIAHEVMQKYNIDRVIVFQYKVIDNELKVLCSVRSRNGTARELAEKYGGGGHNDAAGFTIGINDIKLENSWLLP